MNDGLPFAVLNGQVMKAKVLKNATAKGKLQMKKLDKQSSKAKKAGTSVVIGGHSYIVTSYGLYDPSTGAKIYGGSSIGITWYGKVV